MRPTPVVRINTRIDDKIAQRRHALELKEHKLGGMRIFPRMNPPYSNGVENVDYVVEGSPRYWELTDEENEKSLRRFAAAYGLSFLSVTVFGALSIANINVLTASLYELLSGVAWLISIVGFTFAPALHGLKSSSTMSTGADWLGEIDEESRTTAHVFKKQLRTCRPSKR